MQLPLGGQHHRAGDAHDQQLHPLLLRNGAEHPGHPLQHRSHLHQPGSLRHAAVQAGQAQQVLGNAAETLRLVADVADKLPGGGVVHVLVLENGVRQQTDGRQGRFQLVGGIGNKLPPGALRLLEAVHQVVELPGNLGILIVAGQHRPLVVGPLPDAPDSRLQAVQPPGQLAGKHGAEHDHQGRNADGDTQQSAAEILQQRGLLGIVLVDVHASGDLVAVQHRLGGGGVKRPLLVDAVGLAVPPQGLYQLVVKDIPANRAAHLPGVV